MSGPLSTYAWQKLRAQVRGNICGECGEFIDRTLKWPHPKSFSVDHIVPRSLRPDLALDPRNLSPCHLSCNASKGNGTRGKGRTSRQW